MKFKLLSYVYSGLILAASSFSYAGIIPYGVQTNIDALTVNNWGWNECYTEDEIGGQNSTTASISSSCNMDYTMMGLFNTSTNKFEILAAGLTANVFNDTPGIFGTTIGDGFNKSNGVNWFLFDNPASIYGGWGFFDEISTMRPRHCSTNSTPGKTFCMHMNDVDGVGDGNSADDFIYDVYRVQNGGGSIYPNGSPYQVKFLETNDSEVPEPSTLAIFALGMIGLASRRFKKQS